MVPQSQEVKITHLQFTFDISNSLRHKQCLAKLIATFNKLKLKTGGNIFVWKREVKENIIVFTAKAKTPILTKHNADRLMEFYSMVGNAVEYFFVTNNDDITFVDVTWLNLTSVVTQPKTKRQSRSSPPIQRK